MRVILGTGSAGNNFDRFPDFLKVLGLDDVTVNARPETANIQFFTEYSITEANAPKAVKEKFPSLAFESKERPDLLILIEHHPEAKLIGIEAKMFSAVRPYVDRSAPRAWCRLAQRQGAVVAAGKRDGHAAASTQNH